MKGNIREQSYNMHLLLAIVIMMITLHRVPTKIFALYQCSAELKIFIPILQMKKSELHMISLLNGISHIQQESVALNCGPISRILQLLLPIPHAVTWVYYFWITCVSV